MNTARLARPFSRGYSAILPVFLSLLLAALPAPDTHPENMGPISDNYRKALQFFDEEDYSNARIYFLLASLETPDDQTVLSYLEKCDAILPANASAVQATDVGRAPDGKDNSAEVRKFEENIKKLQNIHELKAIKEEILDEYKTLNAKYDANMALSEKLAKMQESNRSVNENLESTSNSLNMLTSENARLKAVSGSFTEDIRSKEKEITELRGALRDSLGENDRLKKENSEYSLKNKKMSEKPEVEALKAENAKLLKALSVTEENKKNLEGLMATLKSKEREVKSLVELEAAIKVKTARVEELQKKIDALLKEKDGPSGEIALLQAENNKLLKSLSLMEDNKKSLDTLLDNLRSKEREVIGMEAALKAKTAASDAIEAKLAAVTKEMDALNKEKEERTAALRSVSDKAAGEIESLKAENSRLLKSLSATEDNKKNLDGLMEILNAKEREVNALIEKDSALKARAAAADALEANLSVLSKEIDSLKAENRNIYNSFSAKVVELETALRAKTALAEELGLNAAALSKEKDSLNAMLEEYKSKAAETDRSREALAAQEARIDALLSDKTALAKETGSLRDENRSLYNSFSAKVVELETSLKAKTSQTAELEAKIAELSAGGSVKKSLESRIAELQAACDSKSNELAALKTDLTKSKASEEDIKKLSMRTASLTESLSRNDISHKREISRYETQISGLNTKIDLLESHLDKANNKVKDLLQEGGSENIRELVKNNSDTGRKLATLNNKIDSFAASEANSERSISALNKQLDAKEREIIKLKQLLESDKTPAPAPEPFENLDTARAGILAKEKTIADEMEKIRMEKLALTKEAESYSAKKHEIRLLLTKTSDLLDMTIKKEQFLASVNRNLPENVRQSLEKQSASQADTLEDIGKTLSALVDSDMYYGEALEYPATLPPAGQYTTLGSPEPTAKVLPEDPAPQEAGLTPAVTGSDETLSPAQIEAKLKEQRELINQAKEFYKNGNYEEAYYLYKKAYQSTD